MPDLLESSKALLDLDKAGALVPHGLGGHGRACLEWCVNEIDRLRTVITRLGSNEAFDLPTMQVSAELDMRMKFARDALKQ